MKWKKMKEIGNSCQGSWTLYNNCLILHSGWLRVGSKNGKKWIWFWCFDSLEMLAKVVDTDCYNTMELIIWFRKGNWKTSKQTKTSYTIHRPSSLKLRLKSSTLCETHWLKYMAPTFSTNLITIQQDYYDPQFLHLYLHRSNSTAPLKYLRYYHVVPTQLLCWSTYVSTPR